MALPVVHADCDMANAAGPSPTPGVASGVSDGARAAAPRDAPAIVTALAGACREAIGARGRVAREFVIPVTGERADLAVITDSTCLFEVKSGRDTLRRLSRQASAFSRVADHCVLVATSRHLMGAYDVLPVWWGLIEVLDGSTIEFVWRRKVQANPGLDRRSLLLMLRRDEAERALSSLDGRDRTRRRRMSLLAELDSRLADEDLASCVRGALGRRA